MRTPALAAATLVLASSVRAAEYAIDADHSSISFKISHAAGKVLGRFTRFSGTFAYDPKDPSAWGVEAAIDPASISTDNERRDNHLRSADFFDVAKCPALSFKNARVVGFKDGKGKLTGELTMHCATKPVVLDLEFDGAGKDPWGNESVSFTATGRLARKDWGIVWNKILDNGGVFVGDTVDVVLEVTGAPKKK